MQKGTEVYGVRLPVGLKDRFKKVCQLANRPQSEVIKELIDTYIEDEKDNFNQDHLQDEIDWVFNNGKF